MNRSLCINEKISKEKTGLKADLYIHVDHNNGDFLQLRFSEKKKDGNALDTILAAFGDLATFFIKKKIGTSLSIAVNFDANGTFESIRFSGKGFENVATILGETATDIITGLGRK